MNRSFFTRPANIIAAFAGIAVGAICAFAVDSSAHASQPPAFQWFAVKPGSVKVALLAELGPCKFFRIREEGRFDVYAGVGGVNQESCTIAAH